MTRDGCPSASAETSELSLYPRGPQCRGALLHDPLLQMLGWGFGAHGFVPCVLLGATGDTFHCRDVAQGVVMLW